MAQSLAIAAPQCELAKPEGTQEGKKECLPSNSRQTAAAARRGAEEAEDVKAGSWPRIAEVHIKGMISLRHLLHLPIQRNAPNSLAWAIWFSLLSHFRV